jgi:hypothetical protein
MDGLKLWHHHSTDSIDNGCAVASYTISASPILPSWLSFKQKESQDKMAAFFLAWDAWVVPDK